MRPYKKRKRYISNKDSVPNRPGAVEDIVVFLPWKETDWPRAADYPILHRSAMNRVAGGYYCLIYSRLNLGDYYWVLAKGPVDWNTGVCKTAEKAMQNADACLKKAIKCRLLGARHAVLM